MSMPELQTALIGLIDAFAADTGQDVVKVTAARLTLPMEVGFDDTEAGLVAGSRPASTQMRTGFEAPLSTMRFSMVRAPTGEAP
ncbi:hypothetical protein [uncultured Tateyamaria sp.]|uniref:hypothetical protein n=1 Tax=Tateyamaria sp. 1078 TaxID=3417464 RepID=UPI002623D899|nr:hypothetical protein [uncultured Tateyamaria sp.]